LFVLKELLLLGTCLRTFLRFGGLATASSSRQHRLATRLLLRGFRHRHLALAQQWPKDVEEVTDIVLVVSTMIAVVMMTGDAVDAVAQKELVGLDLGDDGDAIDLDRNRFHVDVHDAVALFTFVVIVVVVVAERGKERRMHAAVVVVAIEDGLQ